MRCVRICGGSGERNRKGRLPRASYGAPGIRGEAGAANQSTVAENHS